MEAATARPANNKGESCAVQGASGAVRSIYGQGTIFGPGPAYYEI